MILQRVLYNMFHLVQKSFHLDASFARIQQYHSIEAPSHPMVTQTCATERGLRSVAALSVGFNGTIVIWKPFSNISIFISHGFNNDYTYVKNAVQRAVNARNDTILDSNDRRPRFTLVDSIDRATCMVSHGGLCGEDPSRDALSFFPGERSRHIILYSKSLQGPGRQILEDILIHELGHVQGARHYFSDDEDKKARSAPAARIGTDDPRSVMNYFELPAVPQIQNSDIDALKQLYALTDGRYEGHEVKRIDALPMERCMIQSFDLTDMTDVNNHGEGGHASDPPPAGTGVNQIDMAIMCILTALLFILFYRVSMR